MKTRCNGMGRLYNENYSNRGIKVCDEWKNFMSFYNWSINNGYQEKLTLDRIDNDNNYEPNNCRFVNYSIQNSNKRKYIRLKRNI